MVLIKELDIRFNGTRKYRYGLFLCPVCGNFCERRKYDGLKNKSCSYACHLEEVKGVKRGPQKILKHYRHSTNINLRKIIRKNLITCSKWVPEYTKQATHTTAKRKVVNVINDSTDT